MLNWQIYCLIGTEDTDTFIQTHTGFLGCKTFYGLLNISLEVQQFLVQTSSDTASFQMPV